MTVMMTPDAGCLKSVFLARMALRKEKREGGVSGSREGRWEVGRGFRGDDNIFRKLRVRGGVWVRLR